MISRVLLLVLVIAVGASGEPAAAPDAAAAAKAAAAPILLQLEGTTEREGWTNVGPAPGKGVHVVSPMHDLRDYGNESVTALYAVHVLGHASYGNLEFEDAKSAYGAAEAESESEAGDADSAPRPTQLERTLREWHRVLKPGGLLMVSTPDLHALAKLYLEPALEFRERFFVMRMLFGGQNSPSDFQRTGFDLETLSFFLNGTGFCEMSQRPGDKGFGIFDNDASSAVFKGVPVSVNVVAKACKVGKGEPISVSINADQAEAEANAKADATPVAANAGANAGADAAGAEPAVASAAAVDEGEILDLDASVSGKP